MKQVTFGSVILQRGTDACHTFGYRLLGGVWRDATVASSRRYLHGAISALNDELPSEPNQFDQRFN